jgi:5-methylcytosine-specific restriction endonuclease McrA
LESRVANTLTWARRLIRSCPITAISQELVKFDMQLMQNPEIDGGEYQQGELAGYEVREYLLEKWGRQCAYCGATDVALEIEHILCRKRGGTHRVSNLTISCKACNDRKGTRLIEEFLSEQPDVLKRILAQAKAPLKDTAAVNATRWALYERLQSLGLPLEVGTGGRTKWNRTRRALPKTHWLDAACVGVSTPERLQVERVVPLRIQATGRQSRQMCRMDRYGFPRTSAKGQRIVRGFQTGDIVKAVVTEGTKAGHYVGRVAVRATGSFNITITRGKTVQGISHHYCVPIHRNDGYSYTKGEATFPLAP